MAKIEKEKRRQVRHQMHRQGRERGRSIYWTSGIDTNKRHLTPYLPWKGWLRAKLVAAVTQSPAIGLWNSENVGLLHLQSLPKLCSLSDPKMHLVRQNFNLHITWLMTTKYRDTMTRVCCWKIFLAGASLSATFGPDIWDLFDISLIWGSVVCGWWVSKTVNGFISTIG